MSERTDHTHPTHHRTALALAAPMLALLTLPLVALALGTTPSRFVSSFSDPRVQQALWLSLTTSLVATGFIVVLGTPLAWWMARSHGRFARFVESLADLPLILPPAVAGIALLLTFGRHGLLGELFGTVVFTPAAVVIAQVFVAAPLFLQPAKTVFTELRQSWLDVAALEGATALDRWLYIILPLARPALISGGAAALGRALGEFGATLIFAGNFAGKTQTLPLAVYGLLEQDLDAATDAALILVAAGFGFQLVMRRFGPHPEREA